MLDAEHLASGSPPGGLDLITNEKAPVLPYDPNDLLKVLLGWRDKSSDSLNRLSYEGGNPPRGRSLNGPLQILGTFEVTAWIGQTERTTVTVGIGDVMNSRARCWREPPGIVPTKAHSELSSPAVRVAQRYNVLTPGVKLRYQHRRLVGLGAAVGEKRLLESARGYLSQLLGQPDELLGRIKGRDVLELLRLLLDSLRDLFMAVADAYGEDAAKKIEVLPALNVVYKHSLRMVNHEGFLVIVGHPGKKVVLVLIENLFFFHCATSPFYIKLYRPRGLNPVVYQREEPPLFPFGNPIGFVPVASRGVAQ